MNYFAQPSAGHRIMKDHIAPHLVNMTLTSPVIKDYPKAKHVLVTKLEKLFTQPFVSYQRIDEVTNSRVLAEQVAKRLGYVVWFTQHGKPKGYKLPEA